MKFKFILSVITLFFISNTSFGQCIPGSVNPSIWGTPNDFTLGFTLDSDITDIDTMRITQGEDTSVVLQYLLPKRQNVTTPITGTATVTSVQVQNVIGMPIGLNWTLDAAATANTNTYNPQTNRFGSVTVCGTTFDTPGVKTLTVSAEGCGTLSGFSACDGQTFPLYIEILPGSGGNAGFTMSTPVGCNSLDVDFTSIFQSPDPILSPVDFAWDLGDGTNTTGTTILGHNYPTSGTYNVQMDVLVNEYYISYVALSGVTSASDLLNGIDVSGTFAGGSLPEIGNDDTPQWNNLDIVISNLTLNSSFSDNDDILFIPQSEDLGDYSYNLQPVDLVDGNQVDYNAGGYNVSIVINKRVASSIPFNDTVFVFDNSTANVTSSNGTSFCGTDSTVLDIGPGYSSIQWFNDTILLIGETNESITVNTSGNYYAQITSIGSICPGVSNTISVITDNLVLPLIYSTPNGIAIDNPNLYDIQWFSNGVPIPGAITEELTDLSSGNPFSLMVTNANGCSATSANFDGCLAGYAEAPNGLIVDGNVATTFEAVGFSYNSQTEVAWAVTPVADGMITSAIDVAAINNANIYQGNGNEIDLLLNCSSLYGPGAYYLTPFLIEAVDLPSFPFPYSDSTCTPTMGLSISFDCSDDNFEIGNASVVDPAGNPIDLLSLSPVPISYPIPGSTICGLLSGAIPGVDLFAIAPTSNPNGTWKIEVENSGSVDMNITVPAFQVSLLAADCSDITVDMVYDYGPYDITIEPGETEAISITVPPLPTNFPSIAAACSGFGTPVEIDVTNCVSSIEDIVEVENISLYPNPNNGMFTLAFETYESNKVEVSIVDITGRKILNRNYDNVYGQFSETFDLKNNLNTGFYFMQIKVGNYTTQKKFIVK